MTKLCNTCEYLRYCARSGIEDVGCDRYKRDMTTNEEWFCNLSTEEKATFLAIQVRLGVEFYRTDDERYQDHDWWVKWLKQPYT